MSPYILLVLSTVILAILSFLIWKKTRNIFFPLGMACLYFWSSYGAWTDKVGEMLATASSTGAEYILKNTVASRVQQSSEQLKPTLLNDHSTRAQWEAWVAKYADPSLFSRRTTAELVITAMRQMYLKATTHEADVKGNLFDLVHSDPQTAYWANCGSSSDFLIRVLHQLGIAARKVQLWHTLTDSHVCMEYYSEAFGKYVFYDPLYGAYLLNERGIPASLAEILGEISKHGSKYASWSLTAYRAYEPLSNVPTTAADPRLEYFNGRTYGTILMYYFNVVALAYNDYTSEGKLLPGETVACGRWLVYENLDYSDLASDPDRDAILQAFRSRYSIFENGRYYLAEFVLQPTEPDLSTSKAFTADVFPDFVAALQASQEASADQAALKQWVEANLSAPLPDNLSLLPECIALAMRNMFMRATAHEQDVSGKLYDLVLQHPGNAYWANAESAVDFMIRALNAFGVSARPVHLFFDSQHEHTALEFHSVVFQKDIFYDPLHGVVFKSSVIEPASFADLQNEIARYGLDLSKWDYRPMKLSIVSPLRLQVATDARYEAFNARDYQSVISDYFRLAAVVNVDAAHRVGDSTAESWLVYNGMGGDPRLSASEQQDLLDDFFDQYSVRRNGRCELSLYETVRDF